MSVYGVRDVCVCVCSCVVVSMHVFVFLFSSPPLCVCLCVFKSLPVKEIGRERVHCTMSQ